MCQIPGTCVRSALAQDIPFSHTESEEIASALKQVERRITEEFKPTEQQLEFVRLKLSYLESEAKG